MFFSLFKEKEKLEQQLSEKISLSSELARNINDYQIKLNQLNEKKKYIEESLNELMRHYAQPIFEERLKTYQESPKEENL